MWVLGIKGCETESSSIWVNMVLLWEILVFYSSFAKDCILLGCDSLLSGESFPTFRSNIAPSSLRA